MRRTTTQPNAFPDRRAFLRAGLATTAAGAAWIGLRHRETARITEFTAEQLPAFSIIPVVGDGKWVWTHPPEETGYLEPREFELKIGIQMEGTGNATQLKATTPVPVAFPEQLIRGTKLQTDGCRAVVRPSGAESSQLLLNAPTITRRQTVMAAVTMRLTLFKQYLGYVAERFPAEQPLLPKPFRKQFLQDSPGIQTRLPEVRELAKEITSGHYHPWQKAEAFHYWVRQNIRARIGTYTSVQRALRDRLGDCEERAAVFVALCRAAGIPARLVWVPNHNWAEFYLVDDAGDGHWIPAHTASYSWFGWTGAHELVIQKGDRIQVPEKRRPQRLSRDWSQWMGARPRTRYLAELKPLAPSPGEDAGPGARRKNEQGEWALQRNHPLDDELRDGTRAGRDA